MTAITRAQARWIAVVVFAIAMAWLEAAIVYDLRLLVNRPDPYAPDPLPLQGLLGQVELVREAATLVMLAMIGLIAGRTWPARLGYFAIAFGVWDIFYYVFLRVITGWPRSVFDWDILFLLPLPWWGPVIAPVAIAVLMIVGGTLAAAGALRRPASALWRAHVAGIALGLYVFMADTIGALRQGLDVRQVLPQTFDWVLFGVAFALMAAPVGDALWRWRQRPPGEPRGGYLDRLEVRS